jgi:hypothetical protein
MREFFRSRATRKGLWLWRRAYTSYPRLALLRRRLAAVALASSQRVAAWQTDSTAAVDPKNITWIFCSGRSGSTWLSNMMGELGEHHVWREPRIGQLFGEFYAKTPKEKTKSANFIMGSPTRKAWIFSIRNFALVGARHAFPLLGSEHHLVIKEPGGGVGAPFLMEALPESRMVLLVRDPRDVVASWLDAMNEGSWKKGQKTRDGSESKALVDKRANALVRRVAKRYLQNLQKAKQAYDAHRGPKTLVLYEDLRVDTLGTMKRLYSDLGIAIDVGELSRAVEKHAWENIPEDLKGEGKFFRKASPGGWREDLTPKRAEMVENITNPVLREFYA